MENDTGLSRWMADIAANLLCIILVVLVLLSAGAVATVPPQEATSESVSLPVISDAPVSGARGVDLLFHAVVPPEDRLVLELGPLGVLRRTAAGAEPFDPATVLGQMPVTLLVFSPDAYAETRAMLQQNGSAVAEVTVPEALRSTDPNADAYWSPAYWAALEGVRSVNGFRSVLRRYLSAAPDSAAAEPPALPISSLSALQLIRQFGNLIFASATLIVILAIFRVGLRRVRKSVASRPKARRKQTLRPGGTFTGVK